MYRKCPKCEGKGVYGFDLCSSCNGRGEIDTIAPLERKAFQETLFYVITGLTVIFGAVLLAMSGILQDRGGIGLMFLFIGICLVCVILGMGMSPHQTRQEIKREKMRFMAEYGPEKEKRVSLDELGTDGELPDEAYEGLPEAYKGK